MAALVQELRHVLRHVAAGHAFVAQDCVRERVALVDGHLDAGLRTRDVIFTPELCP